MEGDCLLCRLPSGRDLRYWAPRLHQENWPDGRPKMNLSLTGIAIKGKATFRRSLYHTILVENQVQAIAVDGLGIALENVDNTGLPIVLHVHDNIAAETDEDRADDNLKLFEQSMLQMPNWMGGLPMGVDADYGPRFG
jgi:DNA polymerase